MDGNMSDSLNSKIEVSLVIPCLNEEDTLPLCLEKANQWIQSARGNAEIIVADNGSTDQSISIARRLGARVISVLEPGYGAALMGGIEISQGLYIIMGDADDSYDFSKLTPFLEKCARGMIL
jgi:glycosyltransferase involved in cell wall biosynthesis